MANFSWIGKLDETWQGGHSGASTVSVTLAEFGSRSGVEGKAAVAAFRDWAFTQKLEAFSIAWCESFDPDSLVIVTRRPIK